jgi:hypothetical protein
VRQRGGRHPQAERRSQCYTHQNSNPTIVSYSASVVKIYNATSILHSAY